MINNIIILSAPIQGITDYHWRNAHNEIFGGIDHYFSPFLRIEHGHMRKRDLVDVEPNNNVAYRFSPQLLACKPQDAARMAVTLNEMGYNEIDINLGCPFPPIALHHKGAGLLQYPDEVEALFRQLSKVEGVRYSVKMRLGWDDAAQWRKIMPLFDIIEPQHVVIHPRTGRQQYKGDLALEEFAAALQLCHYPVVYNGEIKTIEDINNIVMQFPNIAAVMIGRGLIENPAMLCHEKGDASHYALFHNCLLDAYATHLNGGEHQLLLKMKSLWETFLPAAPRKCRKAIKKATSMAKYNNAVSELFSTM